MKTLATLMVVALGILGSQSALAWHGHGHGRGHVRFGFGVFVGPPIFAPYYPAPYYYSYSPPYYPPPVVVVPPPPANVVVQSVPGQPPPSPIQNNPPVTELGPAGAPAQSATNQAQSNLVFVYPRQGQSADQMARDRDECSRWAASQIGLGSNASPSQIPGSQAVDYQRAVGACLDARGYSVR